MEPFDWSPGPGQKKELTNITVKGNFGSVRTPFKVLLDRLAQATLPRGKKAALARFLKVPASRVSEWIHAAREPGGEITLRLLEWVTAEEAQRQKSPGAVTSDAKGKDPVNSKHK